MNVGLPEISVKANVGVMTADVLNFAYLWCRQNSVPSVIKKAELLKMFYIFIFMKLLIIKYIYMILFLDIAKGDYKLQCVVWPCVCKMMVQ